MRLGEVFRLGFLSPTAHSQIYQSLGESGLVGLAGFLLYFVILVHYGSTLASCTLGVLPALIVVTGLRSLSEVTFETYEHNPFFFTSFVPILLIVSALYQQERLKSAESADQRRSPKVAA